MTFQAEDGSLQPAFFIEPEGSSTLALCKARLEYLTKKFYRMVRNNLPEFDGMKLVKSECATAENFDLGSN
jgi:hypothetical protein